MRCINAGWGVIAGLALGACSSQDSTPGSTPQPEPSPALAACGAGPYADLEEIAMLSTPAGLEPLAPLAGATVTSNSCPRFTLETKPDGSFAAEVSTKLPFLLRWEHPVALTTLEAEQSLSAAKRGIAHVIPAWFRGLGAGPSEDGTVLLVNVAASHAARGTSTTACEQPDGVQLDVRVENVGLLPSRPLTLADFPGAKLTYYQTGPDATPLPVPGARATSRAGMAIITGLPIEAFIQVLGEKPGCDVTARHGTFTGRTMVERGAVSVVSLEMTERVIPSEQ